MKKFTSLSLAFYIFIASLIPKLDFEEFVKIPRLVSHFYEHTKLNSRLNFIAFLSEHYQTSHKENPEHQDLPFVNHHFANIILAERIQPIFKLYSITIIHFFSIFGKSLFQPPKF
jgi:hypothetical protein